MPQKRPFIRSCADIVFVCPECGELTARVNVVGSILLRRRAEIAAFILKTHQDAEHGRKSTDATNHS